MGFSQPSLRGNRRALLSNLAILSMFFSLTDFLGGLAKAPTDAAREVALVTEARRESDLRQAEVALAEEFPAALLPS